MLKERLFTNRETFAATPQLDGFCRENGTLHARLGGVEMRLEPDPKGNRATVTGDGFRLELAWEPLAVVKGYISGSETIDTAALWRMKTVWQSIFESRTPNMVNPVPVASDLLLDPGSEAR